MWEKFITDLEAEIDSLDDLPDNVRKTPFYSLPNVVKRAAYSFVLYAREKLSLRMLEATIDKSRVAKAGFKKVLRRLRKDIQKDPYFWVLTGILLDCPKAKIRKEDVTRFSPHLNYADRHEVPPEFLIGFLLQSGSLAEIKRRARKESYWEAWYVAKKNARSAKTVDKATGQSGG